MEAILRGCLGMIFLGGVLFFLSEKRKKIPWKLVFVSLLLQIIFAIGILHVSFVAKIFENLSSFFIVILDFTREGSIFVFGNMMDVQSSGFIFAFQILPTIIFFSALTNVATLQLPQKGST